MSKIVREFGVCFICIMRTKTKVPECECGCGGMTKGGRFLPGHDAKLKKELIAHALSGKKRAQKRLEKLGWKRFLKATRPKSV